MLFRSHHALGVGWINVEQLGQMPRDRLALAVQVGGEPDLGRALGGLAQFAHERLLVRVDLVVRLEGSLLDLHARNGALHPLGVLARKVADVASAGDDRIALAEEFLQLLGLRGALHDDEVLGHIGKGSVKEGGFVKSSIFSILHLSMKIWIMSCFFDII